jgi:intracellular multiplication protein IcmO
MVDGLTKRDEIPRHKIRRDTRTLWEQGLDLARSLEGIACIYAFLCCLVFMAPWTFDFCLVVGLGFIPIARSRKPDVPFRVRKSLGEMDYNDTKPGTRIPQKGRGIFLLGNRIEDRADVWATNEDMRTHAFILGSTGAGKTEGLIGIVYNTLVMCSGVAYLDGKADVKLWGQFFSMARAMGREDDIRVINYMTGNADTTKRRADKLSNTTNPFTTGNSESNTQLLVDLMDAAGSGGDMWKGRAISWLSSLMPPLHELRDQGFINLHVGVIRDSAPPLKYFELLEHPGISERSRDGMKAFLSTVPGYNPAKKPEQQSSSFLDQYGFQTMQFTRILGSLADVYGHIYSTAAGEVVYKDVVLNRRILLVMLPALEKSRPELGNLGKINVAALKSMMGTELGGKLEGSKRDLLDARSTNAPMPFVGIFDEFGYFMPDGAALMWAQARGLGFCLVAAGQDLQAFFRTSREETMAIVANCNIKIVGKLEDPDATFDMVRKIAGEAMAAEGEGYDMDNEAVLGGYKVREGVRVGKTERVTLQDLKRQVEGDIHIFIKADIIRARTFYAGPKIAKEFRLNHFVKVLPPNAEVIRARRLDVRNLLNAILGEGLQNIETPSDRLTGLANLSRVPQYQRYSQGRQGVERGILMYLQVATGASNALATGESSESASGSTGGLAHKPVTTPLATPAASEAQSSTDSLLAGLASMVGASDDNVSPPSTEAVAPARVPAASIETFDGGNLESTNVFGSMTRERSGHSHVSVIAQAALPMVEGLFGPTSTNDEAPPTEAGALDRDDTKAKLNRIALGLGAAPEAADEIASGLIATAVDGTHYPKPPKPAATPDKQETMDSVMDDLDALLMGGQP